MNQLYCITERNIEIIGTIINIISIIIIIDICT